MLELKDIKKDYEIGKEGHKDYQKVEALKGVSINFRKCEFVSILGQSGCGKTTLLNIIGGLDQYTSGDLIINGVSTKSYKDRDWDNYRNHSIGFIFQSYNLIPHQTVLQNVELALTLSGISKTERVEKAKAVLEKVGLQDKMKSKPNQLSGGQMQRVAIARALINDPDIILADEPTGALDSKTSVQIMDLLKEISKEKLIIMVTHNPELAETYSTRIIKLLDGSVVDDSNPFDANEKLSVEESETTDNSISENTEQSVVSNTESKKKTHSKDKKVKSMSLFTAFSLSLNNLLTKKARTFLVAFAGSIGIIGIALILSISNGIQLYINKVQEDTLSSYPITLNNTTSDYSAFFGAMIDTNNEERDTSKDIIYVDDSMTNMVNSLQSSIKTNDLESFNNYLIENYEKIKDSINAIRYSYNFDMQIYSADGKTRINPTTILENMGEAFAGLSSMSSYSESMMNYMTIFDEMIDNNALLKSQYDVIAVSQGKNKNTLFENLEYNEVVLVLDRSNQISNMALYMLGIKDQSEIEDILKDAMAGNQIEKSDETYTFNDFLDHTYRILLTTDYYEKTNIPYYNDGSKTYYTWRNKVESMNDQELEEFVKLNGFDVKIVGIVRPNVEAVTSSINGIIGYNKKLTDYVINLTNQSEIVKQQKELKTYDVLTGSQFLTVTTEDIDEWWNSMQNDPIAQYIAQTLFGFDDYNSLSSVKKHKYFDNIMYIKMEDIEMYYMLYKDIIDGMLEQYGFSYSSLTDNAKKIIFASYLPAEHNTYEQTLEILGAVNPSVPSKISIYAVDFESKNAIADFIAEYNKNVDEEKQISYTDYVGLLMSSITDIINVISYVLIAFVSVSLVVSSIMIGIITYISVLERIKEIGILRSIGASKKDIKRVFTSESVIIGFIAGLVGILISLLFTIPINIIIKVLSGISGVAKLPLIGAMILIIISMLLTFIAGLVPAQIASKKDPVIALRTE